MQSRIFNTLLFALSLSTTSALADDFVTVAERSEFRITSSYDETVDFYKRLEAGSPLARLTVFGQTAQQRDLHCLIVSKDGAFTPEVAEKSGKAIILIQNGIHAGEIDGKDASMILLREILITKERAALLDSVIILMVPIFNIDGHENTARYTRPNQYGPDNAGFRVTAQRYNLNRDYLKMDSPETRAWVKLWTAWLPDFFIDNHVTDGHDWQHVVTYSMPWHPNAASQVRDWTNKVFDPYFIPRCTELGFPPAPYAFPMRDHSPGTIGTFVDIPRFSTGYTALWNRPGLLMEMHSLKDYKLRVMGNHAAMVAILEVLNRDCTGLRKAIAAADAELMDGSLESAPLTYEATGDSTYITVLNYPATTDSSTITGGKFQRWDHARPKTDTVPYFGSFRPKISITPPGAYLIPKEWTEVIDRLHGHGVTFDTLASAKDIRVEMYRLDSVKFATEPFEGRVRVSYKTSVRDTTLRYPSGTVVVSTRQLAGKVAMQALEPDGPDSFLSWGFMNTILEQKEYADSYVIDPLADSMYFNDPAIRVAFDARVASDTSFAKNTSAKRDFFYKRSRFAEGGFNWYPITRVMTELPKTLPFGRN